MGQIVEGIQRVLDTELRLEGALVGFELRERGGDAHARGVAAGHGTGDVGG